MDKKNKILKAYAIIVSCSFAILLAVIVSLIANGYQSEVMMYTLLTQTATVIASVTCSIIATIVWIKIGVSDDVDSNSNYGIGFLEKSKFAPSKVYTGTNITHDAFNQELNTAISKTKHYRYLGDKAKYLAKRLDKDITNTNEKLKVEVFLPDYKDETIFTSRINQLRIQNRHINGSPQSDEELIKEEKLDVLKSIYLLKNLSKRYLIDVYLMKEIPACRLEVTDNLLVISLLTALIDGNYYPVTFVYKEENQIQEAYSDYIDEVKIRSRKVDMAQLDDTSIIKIGKEYIDSNISIKMLEDSTLIEGMEWK